MPYKPINDYDWKIKTDSAVEPVTLEALKSHLRDPPADTDDDLTAALRAARYELEAATGRAFVTQTRVLYISEFPSNANPRIWLPGAPVASITHVKYVDSNGTQQTWGTPETEYSARGRFPGWLQLNNGYEYPSHRDDADEIEIEYICGESVTAVDPRVAQALKLRVQMDFDDLDKQEFERVRRSFEAYRNQLNIGDEFASYGGY